MPATKGPRNLLVDIETSPLAAYTWRMYGEQNISLDQLIDPGGVIMVGYRWRGERSAHTLSVHDDGVRGMARATKRLLDEADVVTTWNGVSFDEQPLLQLLFTSGLGRPSPTASIDLFRVVKKEFRAPSNKLDWWAQHLGVGSKIKHEGFRLWIGCMEGDPKAWARMSKYCKQDVNLLDHLLNRFEHGGWLTASGAPHAALFDGDPEGCPACGSSNRQRRGVHRTKVSQYRRYQCKDCGQWYRGLALDVARPTTRPVR